MQGLGKLFDIGFCSPVVDWNTSGATGKRTSFKNCRCITVVANVAIAGGGTDSEVYTLNQANAASGGTSSALAVITKYWVKQGASSTMANTEAWTEVTQAAGSTITLALSAKEHILAVPVYADQLSDGYSYISFDVADPGSGGTRLGSIIYIHSDLEVQRKPANLAALLV
jgi:hypothetical protein